MSDARSEQTAFVALGSNLGDRLQYLQSALDALRADPEITVLNVSPVYESPAHTLPGDEGGPAFLNAVVQVATRIDARTLLARLHGLECEAGRRRNEDSKWAPRTLDLDLLIFGGEVIRGDELTVPHPRLGVRRFVLQPLADLDPLRYVPHPYEKTVADLLAACPDMDRPLRTTYTL